MASLVSAQTDIQVRCVVVEYQYHGWHGESGVVVQTIVKSVNDSVQLNHFLAASRVINIWKRKPNIALNDRAQQLHHQDHVRVIHVKMEARVSTTTIIYSVLVRPVTPVEIVRQTQKVNGLDGRSGVYVSISRKVVNDIVQSVHSHADTGRTNTLKPLLEHVLNQHRVQLHQ